MASANMSDGLIKNLAGAVGVTLTYSMRKESLHRHGHFIGQLRGWHSKNVLVLLTCLRDLMSGWVSRNVMRSGTSSSMDSLAATLPALPATHHLAQLLSCFAHRVCACSFALQLHMHLTCVRSNACFRQVRRGEGMERAGT